MAYHLISGLLARLLAKEEYNVVILGLDNAGKTTFLEKVKDLFTETPGLHPEQIAPTIGQNIGRVLLSSSILQFWDLGGQRELRSIWPKYYADCHAVCFIIDSTDKQRLEEGWTVFESIAKDDRIEGVPTLILANKQDHQDALKVEEIKEMFNKHAPNMQVSEGAVLALSALQGTGVRQAVDWLFLRVQNSRKASLKPRASR